MFRNNVEGHYGQIGAGHLFDLKDKGVDCYIDFLDEMPSASQTKKDTRTLNGALLSDFKSGFGHSKTMVSIGQAV
jgi:hypothetical protein